MELDKVNVAEKANVTNIKKDGAHWRTLNLATIKSIRAQRRVFHVR